ncbi:MAG: haloacid dehalogenase-like hydrolase [Bacteroidales bacterium]|nr:haloacid dehalogenase-like hydrolase [Bacteroidales bacterium]
MKKITVIFVLLSYAIIFMGCDSQTFNIRKDVHTDPLPSWNQTITKQTIIDYVTKVTKEGTADFIPEEDRVATFDNDGTLWAEHPLVQMEFMFYQIAQLLKKKPELANSQPFKAVAEKDEDYLRSMNREELGILMNASQTNRTSAEYEKEVKDFFTSFRYPGRNCSLSQIRYQPQLELIKYLQDHKFKVFICSGGSTDFVRVISKDFYNIEPENVIGSSNKYSYIDSAGINDLYITDELISFNDKQAKPANILSHIGKRPVLACGNVGGGGDVYMLRYSQGSKYPNLQLIVNHNDKEREYEYEENPDVSLSMADEYQWLVIDMIDDWKVIFVK